MGAKQAGRWKYFFLYIACGIALFLTESACRSFSANRLDEKTTVAGHDPSAAGNLSTDTPAATVSEPVSDKGASKHLDAANLALAERNYTIAAWEIEMASTDVPPSLRTEAVYLRGLLYADPKNPTGDWNRAYEIFQRIEKEHPDSRRAVEVRILSCLLDELQSMQTEKQRLIEENSQIYKKLIAEHNSVQRLKSLMKKMKEIDLGIMSEE